MNVNRTFSFSKFGALLFYKQRAMKNEAKTWNLLFYGLGNNVTELFKLW